MNKLLKKPENIIKALWVTLFALPITILLLSTLFSQIQSIEIEGKGDSGHERSIEYPFICTSKSSFVDPPNKYYCDYQTFFGQKHRQVQWLWHQSGISTFYTIAIIILLTTTITLFFLKLPNKL